LQGAPLEEEEEKGEGKEKREGRRHYLPLLFRRTEKRKKEKKVTK